MMFFLLSLIILLFACFCIFVIDVFYYSSVFVASVVLFLKTISYICTSFIRKKTKTMKKDLHPSNYRLVVFKDMSNDYAFLTKSCIDTRESIKWEDGNEYPLVKLEISHTSHPFYTGKMKLVDTAGRIDKFRSRYAKK